jgi:tRNA-specific 2-thiouridylase
LKKKGFEVIAVFMQNWDDYLNASPQPQTTCSQTQDWHDAQQIAQQLSIPIYKINFIQEYWEKIFLNFLKDLKQGRTPNPDILCNKSIKFHCFVEYARKNFSADFIATGHYAKIIKNERSLTKKDYSCYYLAKPKDKEKDQTYFLCQINRRLLNKLIFPLADLTKKEVRQIATELKLINAQKKDSTGICFIGERNFRNFLTNYLKKKEGQLIDIDNQKIKKDKHSGTHYFTIGQRYGLGLQGENEPYYVVGKNVKKNIVYIAKGQQNPWLYSNSCWVKNINWLVKKKELISYFSSSSIIAKFRYRQNGTAVKILFKEKLDQVEVQFSQKQRAIAPGQYAVFYFQDICLGGGIIWASEKLDCHSTPLFNN